ncbi:unnamed protein product [Arctogadus glacialis]
MTGSVDTRWASLTRSVIPLRVTHSWDETTADPGGGFLEPRALEGSSSLCKRTPEALPFFLGIQPVRTGETNPNPHGAPCDSLVTGWLAVVKTAPFTPLCHAKNTPRTRQEHASRHTSSVCGIADGQLYGLTRT